MSVATTGRKQVSFNPEPADDLGLAPEDRGDDEFLDDQEQSLTPDAQALLARTVRALGGAAITIALVIVVLNQVFTLNIITSSSGPFSVSTVTGPTSGALGLLALALLVGGARIVMMQMGGGEGGGL